MKEFIHKQFLRPVMLHELWDVAGRAHTAMQQRAPGAERWGRAVVCVLGGGGQGPGGPGAAGTLVSLSNLTNTGFLYPRALPLLPIYMATPHAS